MYNVEEIKEIIDTAIFEEIYNIGDDFSEEYEIIISLKQRLYDAFGVEEDNNKIKVKIVNATKIEGVNPWYNDKIGKIYEVSSEKTTCCGKDCYCTFQNGTMKQYLQCCDCEIVDDF